MWPPLHIIPSHLAHLCACSVCRRRANEIKRAAARFVSEY